MASGPAKASPNDRGSTQATAATVSDLDRNAYLRSAEGPCYGRGVAQTTFANMRGIAHKGSGGMSIVFPDVCKTPSPAGGAPVPVPYPNIGKSSDTCNGPKTVTVDGQMPMTKGAQYLVSSGDEPGTAGGVMSAKFMSECEFMLYSFDVKFEGRNVCRLGDPLFHNTKNIMG